MEKIKLVGDSNISQIGLVELYLRLLAIQFFKQNNFDITPEQFYIIMLLYRNDGLYQRQLSQHLLKDRANITRMINILENKNFVYRKTDESNKRIHKVYLTDLGKEIFDHIFPKLREIEKCVYKNVSDKEKEALGSVLSKILSNLESKVTIQI